MPSDMQQYAQTRLSELLDIKGFVDASDAIRSIEDLEDDFDAESYCPYYSQQDEVIQELEREFAGAAEDYLCGGSEYKAEDWQQAKTAYAYALAAAAHSHYFAEAKQELIDGISEFEDDAKRELEIDEVQIRFASSCQHGWAAHDRELSDGTMIFESRQLDGCNGIESKVGQTWLSCCVTPSTAIEGGE